MTRKTSGTSLARRATAVIAPALKALPWAGAVTAFAACGALRPAPIQATPQSPSASSRPGLATTPSASPGIYELLPFTSQQLAAATSLAARFTSLYGTYSYDQLPAAYLTALAPLTTPALQAILAQGFTAPGLIGQRNTARESATSTATVTAIRDIGGTSVTFLVTARQDTTSSGVTTRATTEYAVTVASTAGNWRVYAIELATAGQAGSMP